VLDPHSLGRERESGRPRPYLQYLAYLACNVAPAYAFAMNDGARVAGGGIPLDVPVPRVSPAPDMTPDVSDLLSAIDAGSAGRDGGSREEPGNAGARTVIRADSVRALCRGELSLDVQQGIRLSGIRVAGRLDLSAALLEFPVSFIDCEFDDVIDLTDARAAGVIRLERCLLTSFVADRMCTDDDLAVLDGHMTGTLSLVQLQSAGSVRCSGTLIDADGGRPALDGTSLRATGSVLLDRGFRARGEIRLTSAHVDGDLNLNQATCSNPGGYSINASWLVVGGEMLCQQGFRSEGEVFLQWAQLRALRATGAAFINDGGGNAITADGARVATGLFLDKGMHAKGQISLIEAKADGELNCTASILESPGGTALRATRFETREIYLNDGFIADGEVGLGGARVGGQLNCSGGRFRNTGGCALDLGGLTCDGDVFLGAGFRAEGQVRLTRATIQHELNCSGGTFENPAPATGPCGPSRAVDAEGLTTAGSVYLNDNFRATGEVFLFRSNIGQQLDCANCVIDNAGGTALELSGARVHGDIRLISGFHATGRSSHLPGARRAASGLPVGKVRARPRRDRPCRQRPARRGFLHLAARQHPGGLRGPFVCERRAPRRRTGLVAVRPADRADWLRLRVTGEQHRTAGQDQVARRG
jgi:hypothetical protein